MSTTNRVDQLAKRIEHEAKPGERYVVAISGPPGVGKTTIAAEVTLKLVQDGYKAVGIAMDGFHYYRCELDKMKDPVAAHKFRGAPFTFDLPRVKEFAAKLHDRTTDLVCPSFDHAKKDPDSKGAVIPFDADIIIFEGNYLLLNQEGWQDLAQYWDDRWLFSLDEATLRERLAKRHLRAGLVDSIEAGYERADFNDLPNGRVILAHSAYDLKI